MSESELLTYGQVADSLDVTKRTIISYVAEGRLGAVKLGGLTRIRRAERDRFVRELPPVVPGSRKRPSAEGTAA